MSQDHFDHIAHEYDEVFKPHISGHYLKLRIDFIKNLKAGKKVLDYGCGTGVLAEKLKNEGFDVHGADYSEKMLEKAKARGIPGKVCKSGIIPYDADTFDLVYSVAVFHHLETPENVQSTIREMARVTKPGGCVLIWDHNPRNPYWKFLMPRLPQDHGDERLVPLEEIQEGLKKVGFENVRFERRGWIPEFTPSWSMGVMRTVENLLEHAPVIRSISAHNVVTGWKPIR